MAAVVDEMLWLARADGGATVPAAEPQDRSRVACALHSYGRCTSLRTDIPYRKRVRVGAYA
jgi:hypothetical protein